MPIALRSALVLLIIINWLTTGWSQISSSPNITIEFVDASIPSVLRDLSEDSGIRIIFSDNFFDEADLFEGKFEDQPLENVLNEVLQNLNLTFKRKGDAFIISRTKQKTVNLFGFVLESSSKERLPYATIYNVASGQVFTSNESGYYSMSLSPGNYHFQVSYLGHKTRDFNIELSEHTEMEIALNDSNVLPEIIIDEASSEIKYSAQTRFSNEEVMDLSRKAPGLGAAYDLLQTARFLPGVQSGGGGIGGYFVRGGSNDQNLYLLDGVSIYNPFHSLGLSSIFTPHTTKTMRIYKSGFSAKYGDKSSSVIDIRMKDGNGSQIEGEFGYNTQDAFTMIEGPIPKLDGTFLLYGRKSTLTGQFNSIIRNTIFPDERSSSATSYYDIFSKMSFNIGDKHRLLLSFYKGYDDINGEIEEEDDFESSQFESSAETNLTWGNDVISLTWESLLSHSLFLNVQISRNQYFSDLGSFYSVENESFELEDLFFSSITSFNEDFDARFEIDYTLNQTFKIETGAGYVYKSFMPDIYVYTEESDEIEDLDDITFNSIDLIGSQSFLDARKLYHYVEVKSNFRKLVLNLGLRSSYFWSQGDHFFDWQPRLNLDLLLTASSTLSLSATKAVQYVHLLSNTEINLPRDLWFPSYSELPPEESWHYNLGFRRHVDDHFNFSLDAYYKKTDFHSFSSELNYGTTEVEDLFNDLVTSSSYGIEFGSTFHIGKIESHWSYAYSHANHSSLELNNGRSFPFQFDRRHEWKTLSTFQLNEYIILGLSTYVGSGHPLLVTNDVDLEMGLNPVQIDPAGRKNQTRSGIQHRIDFSILYTRQTGKFQHDLKFNIYNVYNQNSPLFYIQDLSSSSTLLEPNFSIPIIPSLAYSVKF